MRAIQIESYVKSPAELAVTTVPDPIPKDDEYRIQVHAAGTNFFDILQVQGRYQTQPPFPWIAGVEFAGVVLATRRRADRPPGFPVGSRVFGAAQGAYASQLSAPEGALLPVPKGWSFAQAAGLFITAPTAYGALVVRGGVKAGDIVLVHAAAGGVGLAAVQGAFRGAIGSPLGVAKACGATVIATASTQRKLQVARAYGADLGVGDAEADWPAQVKALTPARRGVDIVYDPVGPVDASTKCVAWNARILVVGFAAGKIETLTTNKVLLKNIALVGIFWGAYARNEKDTVTLVWKRLMALIAQGKFRPTIFDEDEFVGLERVKDALSALGARKTWGKVVKLPQEGSSRL